MLKVYLSGFDTKSKIIFPMLAKIFAILLFDGFQFYILFNLEIICVLCRQRVCGTAKRKRHLPLWGKCLRD